MISPRPCRRIVLNQYRLVGLAVSLVIAGVAQPANAKAQEMAPALSSLQWRLQPGDTTKQYARTYWLEGRIAPAVVRARAGMMLSWVFSAALGSGLLSAP